MGKVFFPRVIQKRIADQNKRDPLAGFEKIFWDKLCSNDFDALYECYELRLIYEQRYFLRDRQMHQVRPKMQRKIRPDFFLVSQHFYIELKSNRPGYKSSQILKLFCEQEGKKVGACIILTDKKRIHSSLPKAELMVLLPFIFEILEIEEIEPLAVDRYIFKKKKRSTGSKRNKKYENNSGFRNKQKRAQSPR